MRLGDLPLGSKIVTQNTLRTGKVVDIVWTVSSHNHVKKDSNYPENATTLLSDYVTDLSRYSKDDRGFSEFMDSIVAEELNTVFLNSFSQNIQDTMLETQTSSEFNPEYYEPYKIIIPAINEVYVHNMGDENTYPGKLSGRSFDYMDRFFKVKFLPYLADELGESRDYNPQHWTRTETKGDLLAYSTADDSMTRVYIVEELYTSELGVRPIININSDTNLLEHPTLPETYVFNQYTTPSPIEPEEPVDPSPTEKEWRLTHEEDFIGETEFNFINDPNYPWIFHDGYIQSGNIGIKNSTSEIKWRTPPLNKGFVVHVDVSIISNDPRDGAETYVDSSWNWLWEINESVTKKTFHLFGADEMDNPIEVTPENKFLYTSEKDGGYTADFLFKTSDFQSGLQDAHMKIHGIRVYEYIEPSVPTKPEGTNLSDIPLGSKLKLGELSDGTDMLFSVSAHNHYLSDPNYPENTVTLLSDSGVISMNYREGSTTTYNIQDFHWWKFSDIRSWLNEVFYTSLPDLIRSNIPTTGILTKGEYADSIEVVNDKIFLPSSKEIGLFDEAGANNWNPGFGEPYQDTTLGIGEFYWLREPHIKSVEESWFNEYYYLTVDEVGKLWAKERQRNNPAQLAVRPAMNINNNLKVVETEVKGVFEFIDIDKPVEVDKTPQSIENNYIYMLNSQTFEIDHIVDNYESFSMTINYNDVGDFIAQIDNRLENAKYLSEDTVILFGGSDRLSGIITSVELSIDSEGNEIRTIRGKTIGHMLSYRLVESTTASGKVGIKYTGKGEDLIKEVIRKNFIETSAERIVENFEVKETDGLGEFLYGEYLYNNVLDITNEVSQSQDLGWNIIYDEDRKKLVFDVYKGRDLSIAQEANPPVLLSVELGNLASQSYLYDGSDEKNFLYAEVYSSLDTNTQSSWENHGNTNLTGLHRKEEFVKIDLYQPGITSPIEPGYSIPSDIQAQSHLDDNKPLEALDAVVIDEEIFEFGVDYDLGDIITINNGDWKVEADMRVTSMTVESDAKNNDLRIMLSFGSQIPRITDRIKDEIKKYDPDKNIKRK